MDSSTGILDWRMEKTSTVTQLIDSVDQGEEAVNPAPDLLQFGNLLKKKRMRAKFLRMTCWLRKKPIPSLKQGSL